MNMNMNKNKLGIPFFWLLEVNLVLWIFVGGYFIPKDIKPDDFEFEFEFTTYLALVGFLLAAGLQHWAYYNIYKPIK